VLLMTRMLQKSSRAQSFIVDSEIVAVDPSDGSLKSFQELSNRARKDVAVEDVKVAVAVFAFDLMFMDGEVRLCRL
jgi:DNA ligase-1